MRESEREMEEKVSYMYVVERYIRRYICVGEQGREVASKELKQKGTYVCRDSRRGHTKGLSW